MKKIFITLVLIIVGLFLISDKDIEKTYEIIEDSKLIGSAASMALSPDSKLLAIGTGKGYIYLYDRISGKLLLRKKQHSKFINSIEFSRDGKRILTETFQTKEIGVWNYLNGSNFRKNLESLCEGNCIFGYGSVVIHPNKDIVAFRIRRKLYVWDTMRNIAMNTLLGNSKKHLNSVTFDPSGKYISLQFDKRIRIKNIEDPGKYTDIGFNNNIRKIKFSSEGLYMAVIYNYSGFQIGRWDEGIGNYTFLYEKKYETSVDDLVFSNNGKYIAVSEEQKKRESNHKNDKKNIHIYLTESGGVEHVIIKDVRNGFFQAVDFSNDNSMLITKSPYKCNIWELNNKTRMISKSRKEIGCDEALFADDNAIISKVYENGRKLKIYHPNNNAPANYGGAKPKHIKLISNKNNDKLFIYGYKFAQVLNLMESDKSFFVSANENTISNPSFSHDGRYLAVVDNNYINLWDADHASLVLCVKDGLSYSFSDDSSSIIVFHENGNKDIWDIKTKNMLNDTGDTYEGNSFVSYTPDKNYIVYGRMSGGIDFIDTENNLYSHSSDTPYYKQIDYSRDVVANLEFTNNSKYLISSDYNNYNILWRIDDGMPLYGWGEKYHSTNISPGADKIATVYMEYDDINHKVLNTSLRILNALDATVIYDLLINDGYNDVVFTFSPDGKYVAVTGEDNTITIWGLQDGKEMYKFTSHDDIINTLVFDNNSRTLFSASADGTVQARDIITGNIKFIITFLPDNHWVAWAPGKIDYLASKIQGKFGDEYMSARTGGKLFDIRKLSDFRDEHRVESFKQLDTN